MWYRAAACEAGTGMQHEEMDDNIIVSELVRLSNDRVVYSSITAQTLQAIYNLYNGKDFTLSKLCYNLYYNDFYQTRLSVVNTLNMLNKHIYGIDGTDLGCILRNHVSGVEKFDVVHIYGDVKSAYEINIWIHNIMYEAMNLEVVKESYIYTNVYDHGYDNIL